MEELRAGGAPRHESPQSQEREVDLWGSYVSLRLKSEKKDLSDEEFAKLLDDEIIILRQAHPPFDRVFDPEIELKNIKRLPKNERIGALEDFKEKSFLQRHAYMECRRMLERTISHNPDTNPTRLDYISNAFGYSYGFPARYRLQIHSILRDYFEERKKVLALQEKYPDSTELVHQVTSIWTGPETKVTVGPASIDIVTDREHGELMYKKISPDTTSNRFGGFKSESPLHHVMFTVSLTDSLDIEQVRTHEHEHVKNAILREYTDIDGSELGPMLQKEINTETDPFRRQKLIEDSMTLTRDVALDRAKDEITAMLKDGASSYFHRFFSKDGNSYDYLHRHRAEFAEVPEWHAASNKILVNEYEGIITDALKAFKELREGGKYGTDDAIALLTDIPLQYWPATVRHLWR